MPKRSLTYAKGLTPTWLQWKQLVFAGMKTTQNLLPCKFCLSGYKQRENKGSEKIHQYIDMVEYDGDGDTNSSWYAWINS